MDSAASQRLAVITSHVSTAESPQTAVVSSGSGITTLDGEIQYSYPVPERLTATGDWLVHRYSPLQSAHPSYPSGGQGLGYKMGGVLYYRA